jgi:ELWxxDGT repeat protein
MGTGLELVKDYTNEFNSYGYSFDRGIAFGNKFIYYMYTSGLVTNTGGEYWITDGTEAGSKILKDINPGLASGTSYTNGIALNDKFIFSADDGLTGTELWVSDGTEAGTVMLKNIRQGTEGSEPNSFVLFNNLVYFSVYRGINALEFWKTDGTSEGTTLIFDMIPDLNISHLRYPVVVGDKIMFSAYHLTRGWEIWKTDGTAEGTAPVKDIIPGPGDNANFSLININLFALGDKLLFVVDDGIHGNELWVSDGTETGTTVFDIVPGVANSNPTTLRNINGAAYFNAAGKLWRTDGIHLELVSDLEAFEMQYMNEYVYFTAISVEYGAELFKVPFTKSDQVITFDPISAKLFNDNSFNAEASSSENLPVLLSTDSDKISISGNTVTFIQPGSVTITATQSGNGLYNPAPEVSQTFCINPSQPVITIEDDGLGFPQLTSSSDTGNNWFFAGTLLPDETGNTVTVTEPGVYSVQLTIDNCTSVMSAEQNVIITSVEKQRSDLRIFPNPTTNSVTIASDRFMSNDRIEILDSRGKSLQGYCLAGESHVDHSMVHYPNGIYLIKIVSARGVTFKKVIKK